MALTEAAEKLLKTDYSPWERTKGSESKTLRRTSLLPPIAKSLVRDNTLDNSGKRGAYHTSAAFTVGTQSSPWHKKGKRKSSKKSKAALQPKEDRILQNMLTKSRKLAVADSERRRKGLEEANMGLVETIKAQDASAAAEASSLLQQYDRFGGTIASVQAWSARQVSEAKQKLQEAKEITAQRLMELEQQLHALNARLQASQEELHTLRTYRDKEYPVQVLRIAELQREIRKLQEAHQDERVDVDALVDTEMEKLSLMVQSRKLEKLDKIAEEVCNVLLSNILEADVTS
ncbi:uncharacterized protein C20orf96 homolog isoform X2 [Pleurodeles waltl]|uniref:uncharacterized protein C20orf96 homolog isoform X2 n=1 Tax=Pleurodeles waltl TaxID=8319 RepID=UPI0037096CEB